MITYPYNDGRIETWNSFKDYYTLTMYSGDCDPTYPALNYISDRLELNMSQRYWLSFLFGCTYSVPTSYYIFNEFPDMENVDLNRMNNWWTTNKKNLFFQSDRTKVKNFNFFIKCFESYKEVIGTNQESKFLFYNNIINHEDRYKSVYNLTRNIFYFGRFTLFNYLECINEITNLKLLPDTLNLKEAESSCNGLCYASGLSDMVSEHHKLPIKPKDIPLLSAKLLQLKIELQNEHPEINVNYWNLETALCAYKKLFWSDRYFGYYIDRQQEEINIMEKNIQEGVDWSILWDFRKEFFNNKLLGELNNWTGIRKERMKIFSSTGQLLNSEENDIIVDILSKQYNRKVTFNNIGDIYNINRQLPPPPSSIIV